MSAMNVERALMLACWGSADPLLAGLDGEAALIEVAGKSLAQRSVEQAVALGARRIDVVLGERAAPYAACLGDGERWGCAIVYHYAASGPHPLRSIVRQLDGGAEVLLLHADTNLPAGYAPPPGAVGCRRDGGETRWCGWARVPGSALIACAAGADSRQALGRALLATPGVQPVVVDEHASAASAADLLATARSLLATPDYPIGIARRPDAAGVWLGNGARIHPTATVVAPVYVGDRVLIGPAAVIGPNAVIGARSIVDRGAVIVDSIVAPQSYVGADILLDRAILDGQRLVNVALGVDVEIADRELAGSIAKPQRATAPGIVERLLAAALWVAGRPLRGSRRAAAPDAAVEAIYAGVPGAWLRHFREVFHPGLGSVVAGRRRLVGPVPRAQATAPPPGARQIDVAAGRCGLVNESLLQGPDGADPALRYAGDVLAAQKLQIGHIVGAVLRYARMVRADWRAQRPAQQAGAGARFVKSSSLGG